MTIRRRRNPAHRLLAPPGASVISVMAGLLLSVAMPGGQAWSQEGQAQPKAAPAPAANVLPSAKIGTAPAVAPLAVPVEAAEEAVGVLGAAKAAAETVKPAVERVAPSAAQAAKTARAAKSAVARANSIADDPATAAGSAIQPAIRPVQAKPIADPMAAGKRVVAQAVDAAPLGAPAATSPPAAGAPPAAGVTVPESPGAPVPSAEGSEAVADAPPLPRRNPARAAAARAAAARPDLPDAGGAGNDLPVRPAAVSGGGPRGAGRASDMDSDPRGARSGPRPVAGPPTVPPALLNQPSSDFEAGEDEFDDAPESIVLNFEAADIREVIYSFAAALELNYWIDPRVQGQVTIRTSGRIARDDLLPVFHQLLRNNGFVAINNGDMYLIVPAEDAKTKLISPSSTNAKMRGQDHFVMEVIKVRHTSADQLSQTLAPFVSPGGDVLAYPRSNLLVITELASNADRLTELVRTFDTDAFKDMSARVYRIEHAVMEDLGTELQSILEAYQVAESGSSVFIIPLLRLNSLAVIAFDQSVFLHVEHWLSVLDVQAEAGTRRQVYVYQVENSKAVDLSGVLNEIYSDSGGGGRSTRGRSSDADERGLGLGGGLSRRNNQSRGNNQAGGNARSGNDRSRSGGGASGLVLGGGADGNELFEQEVRIVEDETTNSLVILATPRDYQTIRQVLDQLDIVPRQVLIEVLVAEVSLSDSFSFGMNQQILDGSDGQATNGGTDGGTFFESFGEELKLIGALGSGGLSATLSSFRDGVEVYRGVIDTIRNSTHSKILSRPHIMTADNQEARILVGDEVPIITSQADTDTVTNGNSRFLQNVQYRDTGIIISVLPQVNSEGLVNMELSLEVSAVNGDTGTELVQSPTFTTREAETTVVVHSGGTLVIGGIIREGQSESEGGVPYLMDIPFFGRLFRTVSDGLDRTELIVLITPFVVRDRDEAESVTAEFKRRVDSVLTQLDVGERNLDSHHTVILEASGQR